MRSIGPAIGSRGLVAGLLILLVAGQAPLLASDLMLHDDSEPDATAMGWTFLGLTVAALGFAAGSYNESQDELDAAEKDHKRYDAATTVDDTLLVRRKTETHRDDARAAETRANVGLALVLIFALTSYFSFSDDELPDVSLTLTTDSAALQWRF